MRDAFASSWVAPFSLLIKPWRLGEVSLSTHPVAALLIGTLTYGLPLAGFFWFFGVAIHEPWGWWYRIRDEAIKQSPCFFIPLVLIGFLFLFLFFTTYDSKKNGIYLRCFLLAPVFLFIPTTIWLLVTAFRTLNADVMNDDRWDPLAESMWVTMVGSCLWLPLIALIWIVIMGHGFVWLDQRFKVIDPPCPSCGYDLTGTRAAGIERCPECGAAVDLAEDEKKLGAET